MQGVVGALRRNAAAQKVNELVMSKVTSADRVVPRLRAAGLLLLLLISLPISVLGVLIMTAAYGVRVLLGLEAPADQQLPQQKTAIVTGDKPCCLCLQIFFAVLVVTDQVADVNLAHIVQTNK